MTTRPTKTGKKRCRHYDTIPVGRDVLHCLDCGATGKMEFKWTAPKGGKK